MTRDLTGEVKNKYLFATSMSDKVIHNEGYMPFMEGLYSVIQKPDRITVTFYRAGRAVTELVFWQTQSVVFVLTLWEDDLYIPPVSDDDRRIAHKEIALPDITDIMLLITRIAIYTGLQPSFSSDTESSSVFEFIACPR